MQMQRLFRPRNPPATLCAALRAGYRGQNKRYGFLEREIAQGEERCCLLFQLLFLFELLQEGSRRGILCASVPRAVLGGW
jgi:hypothetical protein